MDQPEFTGKEWSRRLRPRGGIEDTDSAGPMDIGGRENQEALSIVVGALRRSRRHSVQEKQK